MVGMTASSVFLKVYIYIEHKPKNFTSKGRLHRVDGELSQHSILRNKSKSLWHLEASPNPSKPPPLSQQQPEHQKQVSRSTAHKKTVDPGRILVTL
jgi:hypothetical protein